MSDVTVVLSTYNQDIEPALKAWKDVDVVVTDDGSDDPPMDLALSYNARFITQPHKGNRWARAVHNGLGLVTTPWVFFTSVDMVPCDGLMDAYIEAWRPTLLCTGPRIFENGTHDERVGFTNTRNFWNVCGTNLFGETEAIHRVGGWFHGYPKGYGLEDYDLGARWVAGGGTIHYVPTAIMYGERSSKPQVSDSRWQLFKKRLGSIGMSKWLQASS